MVRWKEKRVLVTGGAGFIGASLCERLAGLGSSIIIFDNLSSGKSGNVEEIIKKHPDKTKLLVSDCTEPADMKRAISDVDIVFHMAANPEVRLELNDPRNCFRQNIYATHVLLEAVRQGDSVGKLVFASTSTVYGDADILPTPESRGPLKPISIYGASKLASEALVSSYAHLYGFDAALLRLANVVGPRSDHGVIADFIRKLRADTKELEILGDGSQRKSYVYIEDCLDAIITVFEKSRSRVDVFNIGSQDQVTVTRIAEIVTETMGLGEVRFRYSGGIQDGRGWKGDVKKMLLDISKLTALGWRPKYCSEAAVKKTVEGILAALDN